VRHSWPKVPPGEVTRLSQDEHRVLADSSYPNIGIYSFGRGVFEKPPIDGATTSARTLFQVRAKQFIYSRLFAFEGAYGLVPDEYDRSYVSNEFPSFDVDQKRLCPEFLVFHFKLPETWKALAARTVGMGDRWQRIKPDQVLSYEIPLPPLQEQRRIVAMIERLASKIDEAHGLGARLSPEVEVLASAGCRELFAEGGWPHKSVDQIVGRSRLSNGKSVKSAESADGIKCLRLSAMRNGRLDPSDTKPVPLSFSEADPYRVALGDVFVLRGNGSKEFVGRAALATWKVDNIIFPDLFIRIPLQNTDWDPQFFVAFWNSPFVREVVQKHATTTAGIWKINQGHIASVRVPMPPRTEQRRIVAYLDGLQAKVERLKALQAQTRAELDALLPAILDRAFKGEL
jgi:type I restriction enzyme, S subunit